MNFYIFFQRTVAITLIVALLQEACFADICGEQFSITASSTEEFKDIIEVAKVISFLRENKSLSRLPNINIRPIDLLLAAMTTVVEIDNKTHIVKADLTTGSIFNSLKSVKEGALLFDLRNRIWKELNDPIKESLRLSGSYEKGYILTLRTYPNFFDNIVLQDTVFDQASTDLLQQTRRESNGTHRLDPKSLLLAMIQSHDLYFIYELSSFHLTETSSLFERWFGYDQTKIDEVKSILDDIINTNAAHKYTSMLQLQILQQISQRRQVHQKANPINMDVYLLSKFGLFKKGIEKSIDQMNNNKHYYVRIKIKRRILRNTSLNEANEIEEFNNEEIDALVSEDDVKTFLEYHRSFTNEEIELFIQRFIKREENTQPEINNADINGPATIQIPQQRQQLIDRLSRMDQGELEAFIKEIGFEVSSDFMAHLMNPQKVPRDVKPLFIRFIANVKQAGSIFNIRTSNNTYGFKKVRYFNRRNKKTDNILMIIILYILIMVIGF